MASFTFLLTVLIVLLVQVQYVAAQLVYRPETGTTLAAINPGHKVNLVSSGNNSYAQNLKNGQLQRTDYRVQLNNYTRYSPSSTFTLHNTPTADDWLYEHNLVTVKSIVTIVNRLCIGINCGHNWAFAIAGDGLGMVLNKAPIKISFVASTGGAPNLCHR